MERIERPPFKVASLSPLSTPDLVYSCRNLKSFARYRIVSHRLMTFVIQVRSLKATNEAIPFARTFAFGSHTPGFTKFKLFTHV
jgi:hypothetical protein